MPCHVKTGVRVMQAHSNCGIQKVTGTCTEGFGSPCKGIMVAGFASQGLGASQVLGFSIRFAGLGAKGIGQPNARIAGLIHSSCGCAWPRFYRTDKFEALGRSWFGV